MTLILQVLQEDSIYHPVLFSPIISWLKIAIVGNKNQVDELLKQQDQGQQLAAMQQKTIDKLTEQNQLLLESSQEKEEKKVGFWGRLIGQRA